VASSCEYCNQQSGHGIWGCYNSAAEDSICLGFDIMLIGKKNLTLCHITEKFNLPHSGNFLTVRSATRFRRTLLCGAMNASSNECVLCKVQTIDQVAVSNPLT